MNKGMNFRLEEEILIKLSIIAEDNRRSRNQEVDYALRKYIKEYESQNGEIKILSNKIAYKKTPKNQ